MISVPLKLPGASEARMRPPVPPINPERVTVKAGFVM